MREILIKYAGECKSCGVALEINQPAMYEKSMGVFCVGHEPVETEDVRHYRQLKANAKADKYEGWAAKRRERANATLAHNSRYTGDIAFNTQPGHIPLRARVIAQNDRAHESIAVADRMEAKAESLRHVRVAGDAQRRDQIRRDAVDGWITPGMMVDTCHYGILKVIKINKKTVKLEGKFGAVLHDKMFISQLKGGT